MRTRLASELSEADSILDGFLPESGFSSVDITLIPGFNPGPYTGAGNNTYVVSGREPALIDAATGHPRHLQAVSDALSGAELSRVLVTHGHSDHASGSPALAERWPDAEFAKMPWPERDREYGVGWRRIGHGDLIPAGDGAVRVIHTPGHAPDHVCFFDEASGVLFCGDLLIQGRTVVIPASLGGHLTSYLESLEQIRRLEPRRVLPAHGPEIEDLPALVDGYLAHRHQRETQILGALERAEHTKEALVDEIYPSLASVLRFAAGESVLAHLVKLEDEGQVRVQDGEWSLNR